MKILSFCGLCNCSNRADKQKDTNYRFPSIVKNNGKKGLKLLKVRKEEKWLAQILRKDLTETKLERKRTRIKMLFASLSSVFFSHIVHNIRFEKQIHNSKRDKRPENLDKTALQSQCFMSLKAVFNSQKIFVVGQINTVLEKLKTSTNVL